MRKFKTAEDNRTNYIYYFNDGTSYTITPGENGENATIISQLHSMDDDELDAQRREAYHCPVHLDGYHDGDGDDADDRNPYLEDDTYNPLQQILTSIANEERSLQIEKLNRRLEAQQIRLELTEAAKAAIVDAAYDPQYGARPLRRYVQHTVETMLSKRILRGDILPGHTVTVDAINGELTMK